MHGMLGAAVAGAGVVAEEIDPTVQPTRASFYVFVFLAVALILLILSFLRHLRRARTNLGPARQPSTPAPTKQQADGDGR
jgi:hypothetical protein